MSQEIKAQKGDLVRVHYVGKFQGGKVFDTSMEKEAIKAGIYNPSRDYKPLSVTIGTGQVIPGFEEALVGMRINEEKEVVIPPSKGYGVKGNHPLSGKTLVFRIKMVEIKRKS
ncbi:MAG: FKBP-type peptidyl-prolyl cis-trans isomerase [Candidatus Methanosuratincola sp.]